MPKSGSKARVAARAEPQFGRLAWWQLKGLEVSDGTIADWLRQSYLHRRLPRVYAVGHAARSTEADLAEALLYAGPGAMLSHATAAWWRGLLDDQPGEIHVSTPRQCRSLSGIVVHGRRACERVWHHGLPMTTVPQVLLDLAVDHPLRTLRRVLAKADYAGVLDIEAARAQLASGRPGSAKLRAALREHRPDLARTKSGLEIRFLELCERAGLAPPEVNVKVGRWEVDALWRAEKVAVELDGYRNHRSPAQVKRDRQKELDLRTAGLTPLRYGDEQLGKQRTALLADLGTAGVTARKRPGRET